MGGRHLLRRGLFHGEWCTLLDTGLDRISIPRCCPFLPYKIRSQWSAGVSRYTIKLPTRFHLLFRYDVQETAQYIPLHPRIARLVRGFKTYSNYFTVVLSSVPFNIRRNRYVASNLSVEIFIFLAAHAEILFIIMTFRKIKIILTDVNHFG